MRSRTSSAIIPTDESLIPTRLPRSRVCTRRCSPKKAAPTTARTGCNAATRCWWRHSRVRGSNMTSLSFLSRTLSSIVAAIGIIAVAGLTRILVGPTVEPWNTIVELSSAGVSLGFGIWSLRQLARGIDVAAAVCSQAARGDLEARIPGARDGGSMGLLQKSINDMLDIVDAFVRESAASMEYISRGKFFRKVLVRGLPRSFRGGATVINAGIDAMDRRVRDLADVAQGFGSCMDSVARELDAAASALESDAGSMAVAAEETSRQSTAVAVASEQASVNVQTVASAAEE